MDFTSRIELLTLGDELLMGIRENAHLKYIGGQLERYGLILTRNTVVRDDSDEIKTAFADSWERSDILITTGGLAAARVNNTREAIADVLRISLEFVPQVQKTIEEDFLAMGRTMGKRFLRQCYKLEGSEVLPNDFGTAPGIWLEFDGKILIMLPGMASELRPMFENQVIPRLQDKGLLKSYRAYLQLRTIGIDESRIEELLSPVLADYPGLNVSYCLYQGIIDIRLSPDIVAYSWDELKKIGSKCRQVLGEDFFGFGHEDLADGIFNQLSAMEKTFAVAESCTGGKLADAFTNIPGASKVFLGGVVCYSNAAKINLVGVPSALIEQHGAVSAEVAAAMATGVAEKFSSNYGLSITGFAGPGGGTAENPVGTVYIGFHSPAGVCAHKVMYPGQREAIKVRAVNAAFDWMRRKLAQDRLEDYFVDLDMEQHMG